MAITVALIGVVACSSSLPTSLERSEQDFGVGTTWYGSNQRIYHVALLYPRGLGLTSPGYLVGIENIHPSDTARIEGSPSTLLHEGHIITHIVRYGPTAKPDLRGPMKSCVLYTIFDGADAASDAGHRPFERCDPVGNDRSETSSTLEEASLIRLRRSLEEDLKTGKYTHILILVMGWNTDQEKSLKDFNSIAGQMSDAAAGPGRPDFHPLVIGVTWPSQWDLGDWSIVPDTIVHGLSFRNKAGDADEIGRQVLHKILTSVLAARVNAAVSGKTPARMALIGHSFGARMLVSALTHQTGCHLAFDGGDALILLEGAFEVQALFDDGGELKPTFASSKLRTTMTASAHDSAASAAFWGHYAGDIDTFDQICRIGRLGHLQLDKIGCADAYDEHEGYGLDLCTRTSPPQIAATLDDRPVRYFDASRMIDCQSPFARGGAHSDVLRFETARFLLHEINRSAGRPTAPIRPSESACTPSPAKS